MARGVLVDRVSESPFENLAHSDASRRARVGTNEYALLVDTLAFVRDLAVVTLIAAASGWVFRRLGMSVVVGYLLAGMIIGPHTPPFQLVSDRAFIDLLAQLGLLFLVFSIGLGLSFSRLQRLGVTTALATAIGALVMLNLVKLVGMPLRLNETESLFLAGMTMVSSSAIIVKVLEEQSLKHERAGQLALGVTILEDVVAVVMLTLLTSVTHLGSQNDAGLLETVARLGVFVGVLLVLSVVLVPRLLAMVRRRGGIELVTLLVVGGVLGFGWTANSLGYSTALGAFVLGAVVAGTRVRVEIERAFESLRHVFGPIFFVAIGMLFDFSALNESWKLVLIMLAFVTIARPLATTVALLVVGNGLRDSVRAGLLLTPIGEFSFIIAQLGVVALVVPESFQAVAIGLAVGTSLTAPLLARKANAIAERIVAITPNAVLRLLEGYQTRLSSALAGQDTSRLWTSVKPQVLMMAVQLLILGSILVLRPSAEAAVSKHWGSSIAFADDVALYTSIVLGMVFVLPIFALWRSLGRMIETIVDSASGSIEGSTGRPLLVRTLKISLGSVIVLGALSLIPLGLTQHIVGPVVFVGLLMFAVILGHCQSGWRSRFATNIKEQFRQAANPVLTAGLQLPILNRSDEWNLAVEEVVLPSPSPHGGKSIASLAIRQRLGCSIVGIDRQGVVLLNPPATEALYSSDRLLLIGTRAQLAATESFLMASSDDTDGSGAFNDLACESVPVSATFPDSGKSLVELNLLKAFGVQVCGIGREGTRILVPSGGDVVLAGDQLLLLGTHRQIRQAATSLNAR